MWQETFQYIIKHDTVLAQIVAIMGVIIAQIVTVGKIIVDRKDRKQKEKEEAVQEELTIKVVNDGINVHMLNEAILDAANVAIILINDDYNIFTWNDAACAMFGWTEREMRGKPIETILSHSFNARYIMSMNKTVGVQAVNKNGDMFDICLSPSEGRFADEKKFFCAVISPLATLIDLGAGHVMHMHRTKKEIESEQKIDASVEIAYSEDKSTDKESDIVDLKCGI